MSGSEKTSETALRVTSRALELALAPAYQASTIVRRRPNAVIATTMPTTVSAVRSLCRNAFLATRRGRSMFDREGARSGDPRAPDSLNYEFGNDPHGARRARVAIAPALEPTP